jgi:protease-4
MALGFSIVLNLVLLSTFSGSFVDTDNGLREKYHSLARGAADKIAIIEVSGAILDGEGFVEKQIKAVKKDDRVKAVVLRVDSPGGRVTACDYIYHRLKEMLDERDIPLVVSMGGLAASGGYYVSMAVGEEPDVIFAEPSTWCGSIGVIIPHYDLSGLLAQYNVEEDSIASHPLKGIGSPMKKMTDEERAILQGLVDDSFGRFKEIVLAGRPKFREQTEILDKVATGQVFSTGQALEYGLVDKEGFIDDAILRAVELAGLDSEKVRVVKYQRQMGLLDEVLFGSMANTQQQSLVSDVSRILDFSVPRAYYLFTWPTSTDKLD